MLTSLQLSKEDRRNTLQAKVNQLMEMERFVVDTELNKIFLDIKKTYIDPLVGSMTNCLEREDDELKLRHAQGLLKGIRFFEKLKNRIQIDQKNIEAQIKRLDIANAN